MTMTTDARPIPGIGPKLVPILFTATIFLSASLLFFVQPLFTKIVLPHIGGAPAVWTTAMLFFQTILIAGYAYAHFSTRYLPVKGQMALHLALWAVALFFLPLSIRAGWTYDPEQSTVLQTLGLFAFGVGVPFAVLSANAPLIQSWYARSGGPNAEDPYFLYGASNLGSLIALLAFPLAAEPLFGATMIGWGWAAGFVALGLFLFLSGLAARDGAAIRPAPAKVALPKVNQIGKWLLLAFIPSSLMLSVTTKISTDIGSFPLVWVIPLALYLLTFVLVFTNRPWIPRGVQTWLLIAGVFILGMAMSELPLSMLTIAMTVALVVAFFFIALKSHQMLYDARPDHGNLTIFYVTMSVGGALGGLFNSIIAPALFNDLLEARIAVILAAALFFVKGAVPQPKDGFKGLILGLVTLAPMFFAAMRPGVLPLEMLVGMTAALFLVTLTLVRNTGLSAMILTGMVVIFGAHIAEGNAIFRDRSFFGTHRVADEGGLRLYANGTTVHGAQRLADYAEGTRPTPLYYYHPEGPMAQVMTSDFGQAAQSIGIVGLGVGSLACYAQPGQSWAFYEIDAMVDRVARDPSLFTFMSECAGDAPTYLGDARIVLEGQAEARYDVLVIDAYSSDAVPVHLTTIEALELYRERLNPGGILMFHISNRYYEIERPLSRSAEALGLAARIQNYGQHMDLEEGNSPSLVVVMAEDDATLAGLAEDDRWEVLTSDGGRIWTDDFADLLSIMH